MLRGFFEACRTPISSVGGTGGANSSRDRSLGARTVVGVGLIMFSEQSPQRCWNAILMIDGTFFITIQRSIS
jgi:hypothetical protein